MTTKKLSEIGTHVTPCPDSVTQYEPYWTYTADERRELVREAIEQWTENLYGDRNATIPSIDDWLKGQGI